MDWQDRICGLCNLEDLGDEYHYLLKCCHYYNERKDLIKDSSTVSPNTLKMKHLLNGTDKYELINLAKFVSIITDHFKEAQHHSAENCKKWSVYIIQYYSIQFNTLISEMVFVYIALYVHLEYMCICKYVICNMYAQRYPGYNRWYNIYVGFYYVYFVACILQYMSGYDS